MTLLLPQEETQTDTSDDDEIHVICCVTVVNETLCGLRLPGQEESEELIVTCKDCIRKDEESWCPVFGRCPADG